ncbi:MAG TPA: serine/threonine-protein kinase [Quisquiliibacterium sp.]|nr:serine/threonine-protein kinase [Quisquiliibacterium sp.]
MGSQTNAPLPDGLEVGGYRIVRKIASGGFSIVYLAEDADGERFAIKEYLPSTLVRREDGELAPVVTADNLSTYRNGLKCFFEEGRALARILHPNVVRVVNFFRANETVYLVMAFEEGRSLQEIILRNRGREDKVVIPERHLRRVFTEVMHGLREVHANRMLHLDLKPANVYLRLDGTPMLLDFGAARQTLTQDGPKLFPMYTPGFAAPELYRKQQQLGPWTDVYGIGASLFACMVGSPPQPADQREGGDRMPELLAALDGAYSKALVEVVEACMRLDPLQRPQSIFAVQRTLQASDAAAPPESARPQGLARWIDTIVGRFGARRRGDEEPDPASSRGSVR